MKYLNRLLKPLDYMYYRISRAYFKWDVESSITALLSVSLFPVLFILSITLDIITSIYGRAFIIEHKILLSSITITLQIILLFVFHSRYKINREHLKKKWADEKEPLKTIHAVLVVLALLLPFIIIIAGAICSVE